MAKNSIVSRVHSHQYSQVRLVLALHGMENPVLGLPRSSSCGMPLPMLVMTWCIGKTAVAEGLRKRVLQRGSTSGSAHLSERLVER